MLIAYEWRPPKSISGPSVLHSVGRWYRFDFCQPQPALLEGTDISVPTKWSHPWGDYRRCIHSTKFYVLPQILRQGLRAGKHLGKGSVHGVYCYEMATESLAAKSSGHCVYTSPQSDGTFWGPRLECQVAMGRACAPHTPIHLGEGQFAAFEGLLELQHCGCIS